MAHWREDLVAMRTQTINRLRQLVLGSKESVVLLDAGRCGVLRCTV